MRMRGMWVAWIAALALTAMLAATPREGAATPRKVPMEPGPTLGEPDVPGDITMKPRSERVKLRADEFWLWIRTGPGGAIVIVWSPRREESVHAGRALR